LEKDVNSAVFCVNKKALEIFPTHPVFAGKNHLKTIL